MIKEVIKIEKLHIKFKKLHAIKGVNLSIKEGESVALVGTNGSGKTTLIESMLGINHKTSGKIKINVPKNKIGVQFQDSTLPEGLTPRDIINFFNGINNVKISLKEFIKLLKTINMSDFIDRQAHSLSGGQRQKLNILLATISKPDLLILDEVSTGLDITTKNDIIKYFTKKYESKNFTMINISHDEKEILSLTNRFIFIHLGEIIYDKPTKHVLKEFESITNSFDEIPKKYYKKNRNDWYLKTDVNNNTK